jgi:hypothetical protein
MIDKPESVGERSWVIFNRVLEVLRESYMIQIRPKYSREHYLKMGEASRKNKPADYYKTIGKAGADKRWHSGSND